MEELISSFIADTTDKYIQKNLSGNDFEKYYGPWLFFAGCSGVLGLLAGILTTYWG
jgi:hypothetical protein